MTYQRPSTCGNNNCGEVEYRTSSTCSGGSCVQVGYHKSSRSGGTNCVEVSTKIKDGDECWLVRDSKDPDGPVLTFTRAEWVAFLEGVRLNEFDPQESA